MHEFPRTLKFLTLWLLIATGLFIGAQAWQARERQAQFAFESGVVKLQRDRDGHFHWPGQVNGVAVDFIIDTGATVTTLPHSLAVAAGLVAERAVQSETAGGRVRGYVALADLSLAGGVQVQHWHVAVLPALTAPLIGMDLLSRMRFSQQEGVMRIESSVPPAR